jgi:hypothetical protein
VSDSERYALVVALAVGCGAGHGTADPSRRVRRMWTQSTAWRLEIEGQRWMRRWGNRGADVSLRSDGRYRVRVFQLAKRSGIGRHDSEAKLVADLELNVDRI